ncbi:hypothetical protein MKEN_01149700 [Mycena kentingensis (nom. inval.)]|nr:hypothetical protein MKEN_01149700 [Mycena kentingensis (nom. inval.)]
MAASAPSTDLELDLAAYRIPGPDTCYYIPNFITVEEEEYLIGKIKDSPQQRWKQLANRRLQLWGGELTSNNALIAQAMPAFVESYPDIIARLRATGMKYVCRVGVLGELTLTLTICRIADCSASDAQGIMPHEDGPAYFPVVATISLASHCVFHYYRYKKEGAAAEASAKGSIDPEPVLSVLLEPRSVVISRDALYKEHLHAIREVQEDVVVAAAAGDTPRVQFGDTSMLPIANWETVAAKEVKEGLGGVMQRETRYSLTCRDVEKVVQLKVFGKR